MAKPKPKARATKPRKPSPKPAAKRASRAVTSKPKPKPIAGPVLRSLRSVIYQVDDLAKARAFYEAAVGKPPYFDEVYYVGFELDGDELGLHPDVSKLRPGAGGAIAYWRVDDLAATWAHLLALGGGAIEEPHEVGGGLSTAILTDPCGNLVGLIAGHA